MSLARRLAKNAAWLYSAEVLSKIFQIILVIFLARVYGAETFGQYSFAIYFTLLISTIVDAGLDGLIIREVSKRKDDTSRYFNNILLVKLSLAVIAYTLILVLINVLDYTSEVRLLVYAFGGYNILLMLIEFMKSFFKAHEMMHLDSLVKIVEKIVTSVGSLIAVYLGYSLHVVSMVFLGSAIVSLIFCFFLLKRRIVRRRPFDIKFTGRVLKAGIPFAISLILSTFYFRADVLFLNWMEGDMATGIYSSAMQLVEVIVFIPVFLSIAIYPSLSQSFARNIKRYWRLYSKVMKFLVLIVIPISIGLYVLADPALMLFFGPSYVSGVVVLKILAVYCFFRFMMVINLYALLAAKREVVFIKILLVVTTLNLVLNYYLIGHFSIEGAAWAKLIAEIIQVSISFFALKSKVDLKIIPYSIKLVVVGGILFFVSDYFSDHNIVLSVVMGAFCYFVGIFALRILSRDDYVLLKELVPLKKRSK